MRFTQIKLEALGSGKALLFLLEDPLSRTRKTTTTKKPKSEDDEIDSWVKSMKRQAGCHLCRREDGVPETIRTLLCSMAKNKAFKITVRELRDITNKKHDADIGQRGLERHLLNCERDLYDQARGRKSYEQA